MAHFRVSLSNCDQEPIHIPGAIQPHGALVALGPSGREITHASANLETLLGVAPTDAIGRGLDLLVDAASLGQIQDALADPDLGAGQRERFAARPRSGGPECDAVVHRTPEGVLIEFEPAPGGEVHQAAELERLTGRAVSKFRRDDSLEALCGSCASAVRHLSGFDRVMIYRFDDDWNGAVIAEEKRDDQESFLGLHYPASDIPSQARELYARNPVRYIANRGYTPVPIEPPSGPGAPASLDLSHAVLRSVSPVHLEYLANMGVGASLSISLLDGESLWGLVACHHDAPRYLHYEVRAACELLGQVMSIQLMRVGKPRPASYDERTRRIGAELARHVEHADDIGLALTRSSPTLLDFLGSNGAAFVAGDEVTRIGQTPGAGEILEISDRLAAGGEEVFATDQLGRVVSIDAIGAVSAGLLAISIPGGRRQQILWFRPEQIRTVNWAGDPSKHLEKGGNGVRLSPRGSFSLWKETVRGRSRPWTSVDLAAAADFRREISSALLRRADGLAGQNRELRRAGAEAERLLDGERTARGQAEHLNRLKDEFVSTLSHELRTPLNAILGWAQILRTGAAQPRKVLETAEVIERNARVQVKMIEDLLDISRIASGKLQLEVVPVDLTAVVADAVVTVGPAASAKDIRIERILDPLRGVTIAGDPERLQQVIWNLLSNAVKFTPRGGRVRVIAERTDSQVEIHISDTGQGIAAKFLPHVFDRFRQEDASTNRSHGGLGLGLAIVRHLVELHGGSVFASSGGEGRGSDFVVSLPLLPVSRQAHRGEEPPAWAPRHAEPDPLDLESVRALIVDDEPDARELIRQVLAACGVLAVTASSADEALAAFRRAPFDVVISDIGMPVVDGFAFIERLRHLEAELGRPKTPAVALTAYARPEDRRRIMLAGYQFHLAKPVEPSEITAVVANLVGRV